METDPPHKVVPPEEPADRSPLDDDDTPPPPMPPAVDDPGFDAAEVADLPYKLG